MRKLLWIVLVGGGLAMGCATAKGSDSVPSLYRSEEARRVCWASYDRALTLAGTTFEDRWIDTPYGSTHAIVAGPSEAPPLVLLPGLFADATMWYPNLAALERHYRVYALDMISYGGKGTPSKRGLASKNDYVAWFAAVLESFGLQRVSLAGLSYGSWAALTIAQGRPELVETLILLDPSESFIPMDGGIAWRGFWSFVAFPNRANYTSFFQWLGGGYTDPAMEVWFEHLLDVIEFGTASMATMPRHLYRPEELQAVTMPVLILAGGKPILYKDPQKFADAAKAALPQAEVIVVEGAGHGLNMEKPDLVNSRMLAFLEISRGAQP